MGNKDKTQKLFMACSDIFVELINGLIYHGKEILEEKSVIPGPTESIYQGSEAELSSQFQDCSMYDVHNGQIHALYTLENQSSIDSLMPLRCAGYERAAYRRQYKSGSEQGIYPVISVVLNWSDQPWKAATSVRELLDYSVPADAEDYLDKNRIHVFDMRFLEKSTRELFEGDVRVVLDYLSDRESMIRRRQKLRNPVEVMKMLHALSGDTRYLEGITFMQENEGEKSVCDLLDYMVNQGIQQGLQEGVRVLITTYKEFGVTYEAAVAGVKQKYDLDDAEVQRNMKLYW
ncbi:MAG: Rpn family recombination-promoting nuclease/putative transposase [Acetatifactor sp.]|nr:Rpn family recombination-promoting nuclease/putative transposase [Acetatifactor sp.]